MSALKSFLSSGGEWAVSSLFSMVGVRGEADKREGEERRCGDGQRTGGGLKRTEKEFETRARGEGRAMEIRVKRAYLQSSPVERLSSPRHVYYLQPSASVLDLRSLPGDK